jgi:peptidoglycan hydrolase-like protein with peptidoglycan-binding domain
MIYAKQGMRGHNVSVWQENMNKIRAKTGNPKLVVDGIFGPNTKRATIKTQKYLGVTADGIVGEQTYKAFVRKHPIVSFGWIGQDFSKADKKYFNTEAINRGKQNLAIHRRTTIFPTSSKRILPRPPVTTTPPKPKKEGSILPLVAIAGLVFMNS